MKEVFHRISSKVSGAVGTPFAFLLALSIVIVWAITGPAFGFSDTWQLVINTGTTIVTFLMVFLIQNTQNRDAKAVHLKLDELIHSSKSARNSFVDLEDLSDADLASLDNDFKTFHEKQMSSAHMKKLHAKILEEHHRRKSLGGQISHVTSQVISSILDLPAEERELIARKIKKD